MFARNRIDRGGSFAPDVIAKAVVSHTDARTLMKVLGSLRYHMRRIEGCDTGGANCRASTPPLARGCEACFVHHDSAVGLDEGFGVHLGSGLKSEALNDYPERIWRRPC